MLVLGPQSDHLSVFVEPSDAAGEELERIVGADTVAALRLGGDRSGPRRLHRPSHRHR
jgi:hypothetical protein